MLFLSIIIISEPSRLSAKFSQSNEKAQLIAYLTAGYPNPTETVDLLLAMQNGGADILELGIPFTDPQADGATIQRANEVALSYKVTLDNCIDMVSAHRKHTLESCKENASKYKTRNEWQKNDSASYFSAKNYGWLNECMPKKIKSLD